jgi:hypothetical protein
LGWVIADAVGTVYQDVGDDAVMVERYGHSLLATGSIS